MRLRWLFFVLFCEFISLSLASAQSTELLIVEVNPLSERNTQTLNPLFCENLGCKRIADLLFPALLNIDAATGTLLPANEETGLVDSWQVDGNLVTYTLRDDRTWSDGTPITAYDVFFSFQLALQGNRYRFALEAHIEAAVPVDEHSIQFLFANANCDALPQANFRVIPSHVYVADFPQTVNYDGSDIVTWYERFLFPESTMFMTSPEYSDPTVTGGTYRLAERRVDESIDLISTDGQVAYRFVDLDGVSAADSYLRGDLNLLVDPPYNRRADLRADETTIVHTYPGNTATFIMLNLADPDNPQPAFDEDGNPIGQGVHPILGDPVVRQAMQMALDVDAMIGAVLEADGVQLAALLPPAALGFNPVLGPIAQDVMGARQLLFDAGWRDIDGDGWRECLNCELAEQGTQLTIQLDTTQSPGAEQQVDLFAVVSLLQKQLRAVGIEVIPGQQPPGQIIQQRFDAALVDGVPVDLLIVKLWDFMRSENDSPGNGLNLTSYANPEVDRLLAAVDDVPDCDVEERQVLLQEVEAILQADQPYLWLFSPNRMIATRHQNQPDTAFWEQFLP